MPTPKTSLNDLLYDVRRISEHREVLTDKKIQAVYQSLSKDLDSFIADTYKKYADEDGRLYVSYLDANNQKAKFMQEIITNVDGISPEIRQELQSLVEETYTKSYEGMVSALKKADTAKKLEAVAKDIAVNPNVLKQAINNNISKLTLPTVLQKQRAETIYQIQQELNIGLMQGDRYEKMAQRISERIGVSQSKAMNIARTETHRNIESGLMDSAEHIQDGLEGSELIYAATWRTMKDERVRPQQRRKTKKGWKTTLSKNGANHMKMEGVTVKVGDDFDLGNGVKAKAPSKSGSAANDCNCRCYLEYNLMTLEEFAKATGKTVQSVIKSRSKNIGSVSQEQRQLMDENGIANVQLEETDDKEEFSKALKSGAFSNTHGGAVDVQSAEDVKEYRTYIAKNGLAGVAVKPDGDITAVFKNENYKERGVVNDLIITARANGGTKMDCYGRDLVSMYERCGYVPVAKVPFNADFVSDPWLLETKPDVYVLMKNSDTLEEVIEKNAAKAYKVSTQEQLDKLQVFSDPDKGYDQAMAYRDDLLKKQ